MDGVFFGTTFPHLLLMTYPSLRPPRPTETYVPRVFGFKLHESALTHPPADATPAQRQNGAPCAYPRAGVSVPGCVLRCLHPYQLLAGASLRCSIFSIGANRGSLTGGALV